MFEQELYVRLCARCWACSQKENVHLPCLCWPTDVAGNIKGTRNRAVKFSRYCEGRAMEERQKFEE